MNFNNKVSWLNEKTILGYVNQTFKRTYTDLFEVLSDQEREVLMSHQLGLIKWDIAKVNNEEYVTIQETFETLLSYLNINQSHILYNKIKNIQSGIMNWSFTEQDMYDLIRNKYFSDPVLSHKIIKYMRNRSVDWSVTLFCPYMNTVK